MLTVTKAALWAATCEDQPGGVMGRLEGLSRSGVDPEYISARRLEREPGKGVVFIAPLRDEAQRAAAGKLGFAPAKGVIAVRVEAPSEAGLAYLFARALAGEGINLRSILSLARQREYVAYLTFDCDEDADRAIARLKQPL